MAQGSRHGPAPHRAGRQESEPENGEERLAKGIETRSESGPAWETISWSQQSSHTSSQMPRAIRPVPLCRELDEILQALRGLGPARFLDGLRAPGMLVKMPAGLRQRSQCCL